jgi:Mn-dependent DtxR family transcriptional regulator
MTPQEGKMKTEKQQLLTSFFESIESLDSDQMMKLVEQHLSDEDVEVIIEHIEKFYGVDDDEELGMLAQLVVTGYLAAKHETKLNLPKQ